MFILVTYSILSLLNLLVMSISVALDRLPLRTHVRFLIDGYESRVFLKRNLHVLFLPVCISSFNLSSRKKCRLCLCTGVLKEVTLTVVEQAIY